MGFFGKVPARGDFVRRGLPASFVEPWDRWLQVGIAGSRELLGDAWLDLYLTCPVWRFALSADLAGDLAAAGVLIPSVDGVGRYFPFTLACVLEGAPPPLQVRAEAAWFERAQALALAVLEEDGSLEQVIEGLGRLGCPAPAPSAVLDGGAWRFDEAGAGLARSLVGCFTRPHALFWTSGSAQVRPSTLFTRELPSARQFTALLDGAWADHGWRQGPS